MAKRLVTLAGIGVLALGVSCAPLTRPQEGEVIPKAYDHQILYRLESPDINSFAVDERFLRVDVGPSFSLSHVFEARWRKGGPVDLLCQWPNVDIYNFAAVEYNNSEGCLRIGLKRDVPVRMLRKSTSDPAVLAALETVWSQLQRLTFYRFGGCADGVSYEIETYSANGLGRRLSLHPCYNPALGGEHLVAITDRLSELAVSGKIPENWLSGWDFPSHAGQGADLNCYDDPLGKRCVEALSAATEMASKSEQEIRDFVQPECPPKLKMPATWEEQVVFMKQAGANSERARFCHAEKYPPDRRNF